MSNSYKEFDQLVEAADNIIITSHLRPDADAIGSVLAVKAYIDAKFPHKQARINISGAPTQVWDFMDKQKQVQWVGDISNQIQSGDLVIFLDASQLSRFSDSPQAIKLNAIKTICIDHHPDSTDKFDFSYIDTNSVANCHNIYKLLFEQQQQLLTQQCIESLLMGILGDTGTFRFVSYHNADILDTAKLLIEKGQIKMQSFELGLAQLSAADIDMMQQLLANAQHVHETDPKRSFTFTYLPLSILETYPNEHIIKAAVNKFLYQFMGKLANCRWGFVVTPRSTSDISIGFRSTPGGPSVRLIAQEFGGGGHPLTSGAQYLIKPGEIIDSKDIALSFAQKIKTLDFTYVD
jgi:phosphoesterase RecJ-like protein